MQLEVYETASETYAAAAEQVVALVRDAGGRVTVALPGDRAGRALLAALVEHPELAQDRIEWFVTDEACGEGRAPQTNAGLLEEHLFEPLGIDRARLHAPGADLDPARARTAWEEDLGRCTAGQGTLDVVVLAVRVHGGVAGLRPGQAAAGVTCVDEDGRVSLGPETLVQARAVVVVATGPEVAAAVQRVLRGPGNLTEEPLSLVRPGATRTWYVDRDAAEPLLRTAAPAPGGTT